MMKIPRNIAFMFLLAVFALGYAFFSWAELLKFIILTSIYAIILPGILTVTFSSRLSELDRMSGAIVFVPIFFIGAGIAGAAGAALYFSGSIAVFVFFEVVDKYSKPINIPE